VDRNTLVLPIGAGLAAQPRSEGVDTCEVSRKNEWCLVVGDWEIPIPGRPGSGRYRGRPAAGARANPIFRLVSRLCERGPMILTIATSEPGSSRPSRGTRAGLVPRSCSSFGQVGQQAAQPNLTPDGEPGDGPATGGRKGKT
jgi:hypothetical protein